MRNCRAAEISSRGGDAGAGFALTGSCQLDRRMQSDRRIVNIALIGFMGTGKTSVGRLVAEQLHFDYLDTDEMIQTATGTDHCGHFQDGRRNSLSRAGRKSRRGTCRADKNRHRHRRRPAGESEKSRQPQNARAGRLPLGVAGKNLGTRAKTSRIVRCCTTRIRRRKSANCSPRASRFTNRPTCC